MTVAARFRRVQSICRALKCSEISILSFHNPASGVFERRSPLWPFGGVSTTRAHQRFLIDHDRDSATTCCGRFSSSIISECRDETSESNSGCLRSCDPIDLLYKSCTVLKSTRRDGKVVRFIVLCAIAMTVSGGVQSASGQATSPTGVEAQGPTSSPSPNFDLRFSSAWNSQYGTYTYVPEQWGDLHLRLENGRDDSREILCATYFGEQSTLQFARRIWLPARSKLSISHPVLIPKLNDAKNRNVNLHSLVIESSKAGEVLVKNDTGQLTHDGVLLATNTLRNTAIVAEAGTGLNVSKDVLDLIIASRVCQKLNNKVTVLADPFLPADEASLNYLDHIVIAENRLADDDATLAAIRRWLHAGGRLWIMLDRVDPTILEKLFGDDFTGHFVDQVGLTTVRVDKPPNLAVAETSAGEIVEFDVPVQMTRMIVSDMKVWHTVNGWPAAMTKAYGEGRLLITTLAPYGWINRRTIEKEKSIDPLFQSEYIARAPLMDLASHILSKREPSLLPKSILEPMVAEYVGYTVPSWGLIVGIMLSFLLLLVGTGLWLLRSGRLEHLGWLGSIFAIAFGVALITIGRAHRHSIPGTLASVQFAQAIRGTDDVRTQGMIAVYHPEGSQDPIQTTRGGRLWPDMTGLENSTRRFVTTDFGQSHWESLAQTPGLRVAPFANSESVFGRIEAHATLNANGIVGQYLGPSVVEADALVATRTGRIGVKLHSDGSFEANANDVFEKDQFLNANFLGDEQDRRRRILGELLNKRNRKSYPDRPQLLVWSDRWEHGFQFGGELKKQGTTLLNVPLIFNRPQTGTEILIPPPLVTFRTRSNPDGSQPSGIWNDLHEEWQERSTPGLNWLSFQIPQEFLPLATIRATVQIQVAGPMGRIELMGLNQGKIVSLKTVVDPVGLLTIEIHDTEVLSLSDDGRLSLGLSAGDPTRPELTGIAATNSALSPSLIKTNAASVKVNKDAKANFWTIESLTLSLWAKTTDETKKN